MSLDRLRKAASIWDLTAEVRATGGDWAGAYQAATEAHQIRLDVLQQLSQDPRKVADCDAEQTAGQSDRQSV